VTAIGSRADPAALGRALAVRLAEITAALDRYAEFAFAPGDPAAPSALEPGEGREAARELVHRAFRAACDPLNDRILRRLAAGDATLAELAAIAGLPRLAVWERVSDLVQTGLVARSLAADGAGLTEAGETLLGLVDEAVAAAAGEADA
jgi:hypothetical protein